MTSQNGSLDLEALKHAFELFQSDAECAVDRGSDPDDRDGLRSDDWMEKGEYAGLVRHPARKFGRQFGNVEDFFARCWLGR